MLTEDDLAAKVAQAFGEQASRRTPATIDAAGIFRRGRRRRHRQLATGAASVTAVVGLVAGLLIGGVGSPPSAPVAQSPTRPSATPTSSTQPKGGQLPGNTLLDTAVVPMLSAAQADAGMPKYYVLSPDVGDSTVLQVHDSMTGKLISTAAPTAACVLKTFTIAAAGNDRDFVVGCDTRESTLFYRLQITPSGHIAKISPLSVPFPDDSTLIDMALTADGSKLAISFSAPGKGGELEVVTLATNAVRTWIGGPAGMSWAENGRELGFFSGSSLGGLHVLNVNTPGNNLDRVPLILPRKVGSDFVQDATLSSDGTMAIAVVSYHLPMHVHLTPDSVVGGIVQISVKTGKPLRTLMVQHPADEKVGGIFVTECLVGSIDATGNHLLLNCNQFGRLDRSRFTALPGIPYNTFFSGAW